MEEEVVDIFMYLVIIPNQMDIDLGINFLTKLEKNKERFKIRVLSQRQKEEAVRKDFEFELRALKNRSRKKVIDFVQEVSRKYARNKDLIKKLQDLLKRNNLMIKENPQRFLRTVLLSCVLADIGDQMSPYIRNENIEMIKSICKEENLNYEQLVDLTTCGNGMIEILSSFMNTERPIKLVTDN
jgi:hypothetical protein